MASGVEKMEAGPMVAASFRGNLGVVVVVVSDSTGRALFLEAWGLLGLLGPFGARQGPESTNRRCTILIDAAWLALVLVLVPVPSEGRFALWMWLAGPLMDRTVPSFGHLPAAN